MEIPLYPPGVPLSQVLELVDELGLDLPCETPGVKWSARKRLNRPGAYILTDPITAKKYVGSTKGLYDRIRNHNSSLKQGINKNKYLQALYDLSPSKEILIHLILANDREHAYDIEQTLIDHYRRQGILLNIAPNARGSLGKTVSATTRARLSTLKKGTMLSTTTRAKISAAHRGKRLKAEHAEKLAALNKLRWQDPVFRAHWESTKLKPAIIEGVWYRSLSAAAEVYGVTAGRVRSRILSQNPMFINWKYAD